MIPGIILQVQEAASQVLVTGNEKEITLPVIDLVIRGGWIMAILGLLSVIAVYIFIERYFVIAKASKEDKNFMNNISKFIKEGKLDSAKALCVSNNSPIGRMIDKGLSRIGKPLNIKIGKKCCRTCYHCRSSSYAWFPRNGYWYDKGFLRYVDGR